LNRITTSLSQHVSNLNSYAKQFSDLDSQQKSLLGNIREQKDSLERDAHSRLNTAIPEIAEQTRTMENIEKRVEQARERLADHSKMVSTS
jgi:chromosome segregation ATPase